MTIPASTLAERLDNLRRQRDTVLLEARPQGIGDDADRATNVDAHVQLAMLDKRIADVEYAMSEGVTSTADQNVVALGRSVTLDLGEGPETYTVAPAELAGPDIDVVTPDSALGKVILGAGAGFATTYAPRPGRTMHVTVLEVA